MFGTKEKRRDKPKLAVIVQIAVNLGYLDSKQAEDANSHISVGHQDEDRIQCLVHQGWLTQEQAKTVNEVLEKEYPEQAVSELTRRAKGAFKKHDSSRIQLNDVLNALKRKKEEEAA